MLKTFLIAAGAATVAFATAGSAQQAGSKSLTRAEMIAKLNGGFAANDTNKDGFLSAAEVQAVQNRELQTVQAQARAKLQEQYKQLDTNKDGQLSFAEFSALTTIKANQTPAELIQRLDTNKDGKISSAEFKSRQLAAFDKIDTNHDGTVSVAEQNAAMKK